MANFGRLQGHGQLVALILVLGGLGLWFIIPDHFPAVTPEPTTSNLTEAQDIVLRGEPAVLDAIVSVAPVNGREHGSSVIDSEGDWLDFVKTEPAHPRFTQWDGETFWAIVRVRHGEAYLKHLYCSEMYGRGHLADIRRIEKKYEDNALEVPLRLREMELRQVNVADVTTDFAFGIYVEGIKGSVDRIVCDNYITR